jgi:CRP/FNR family cyclic AMP-dependent transcriptional regulator
MPVLIGTLAKLPFLAGLDQETLKAIVPHVREQSCSPGQIVALEGEPCQAVYFPVRGLLRARRSSADGREQVLSYSGLGSCFNLVSALDGRGNVATIEAVTEVALYDVSCRDLKRLMAEHQEMALAVSQYFAGEVRRLSDMVESLALHTVRARLARFLLDSAEGRVAPRRWTQEEIAAHIGTVREMVGRSLRHFLVHGWVRRERGRVVIVDRPSLERESTGME